VSAEGMLTVAASAGGTAEALRRDFDDRFARPAASTMERWEDLLAIRAGPDPYALRLSEIGALHADMHIVPVPSPVAQLLGIVGVRGVMAPIYDLAALLHYPPAVSPRWVVFAHAPQPVGFAFELLESHLRVSQTSLSDTESDVSHREVAGRLIRGTVRVAGALRPLIHMASVVESIGGQKS
jgi:chemotaxis signal transduction protein